MEKQVSQVSQQGLAEMDNGTVDRRRFVMGAGLGLAASSVLAIPGSNVLAATPGAMATQETQSAGRPKASAQYPIKFVPLEQYKEFFAHIKLTREDGILTVRLHGNEGEFTWSVGAHHELAMLWNYIGSDPENKVIILTGTGNNYLAKTEYEPEIFKNLDSADYLLISQDGRKLVNDFIDIEQPVIAALNGPVHMHSQIPLLCDIVIATPETTIKDHHLPNAVPSDGHHVVWPMVFGLHRANYFFLMQKTISSVEAQQLGAISEIVDREKLLPRANEIAQSLLKIDPIALRTYRQSVMQPVKRAMLESLSLGILTVGYGFLRR